MKKPITGKSAVATREANKDRKTERDPNRLSWGGLKLAYSPDFDKAGAQIPYSRRFTNDKGKEVQATEKFRIRVMPEHAERNPNGYVQQIKMKLRMPGAPKHTYVMSPASLNNDTEACPFYRLQEAFDQKFKESAEFRDWWDSIDTRILSSREAQDPVALRDAQFKVDYLAFCSPWITYYLPVLIYADYDEKASANGKYTDTLNYRPNQKNPTPRILELGDWKMTRDLVEAMNVVEDFDLLNSDDPDERDAAPVKINSAMNGIPISIWRQLIGGKDGKVSYEFELVPGASRGPLPKDIAAKLRTDTDDEKLNETNAKNYPDILKWKVENDLKKDEEMMLLLRKSTLGEVLLEKGLLFEGDMTPPELPFDIDSEDDPFK